MKIKQLSFLLILLICSSSTILASGTLKGNISDTSAHESLIGVNIETNGKGTTSDLEGNYSLQLDAGTYTITYSYLGYSEIKKTITIVDNETIELNINLEVEPKNLLGNDVVITGSFFEKRASEEVISIELIKPKQLANSNILRIDEMARRVSGLNVADGQANIRAGSGWSYGVGSRVMVVLDGLTMLSPDRGDVKWSTLPTENVGQIEVLKGASSVLYGSSAMNGTIHLQSFKPTKKPVTKFTLFQSFLTPPKRKETKWWEFPVPSFGASFMRAHKPTDNFEYVVGGSFYINNLPYQNGLEYLTRVTYRTKWTSKKKPTISWGIAGMMMYNREYEFFYWQNDKDGAYKASADNRFENIRLTVDPFLTIFDKKGNKHEIKTRTYFNRPSFSTKTILENINYQFSKRWASKNLNLTTGIDEQFFWINVPAFIEGGKKTGNLFSAFFQLDKKYKKLTLTGGARFELFQYQKTVGVTGAQFRDKNGKLKFYLPGQWRAGLNYEITKQTFMRFNIGQAYRFPSFAERFVNEQVGDIGGQRALAILPNTSLVPEYGWTSEIGFQQTITPKKTPHYRGLLDAAFFWQEYKNIVETETVFNDTTTNALIKLRFNNITRARIAGWDISFKNDVTYKKHALSFNIGYTYSLPAQLYDTTNFGFDKVGKYLKYLFKQTVHPFGNDTAQQILKYRNRHLLTIDFEYTYNNFFTFGFDARYYSRMENYDAIFVLIPGVNDYLQRISGIKGYFVLNTRTFFTIKKKHTFGIIVNNILNTEYWLRVGKIEAPRSVTMQYRLEF